MLEYIGKQYVKEIATYNNISNEERQKLNEEVIKDIQAGNKERFTDFVLINYNLLQKIAITLYTRGATLVMKEDIDVYLLENTYKCILRYTFDKNTKISTFLYRSFLHADHIYKSTPCRTAVAMPINLFSKAMQVYIGYYNYIDAGYNCKKAVKAVAKQCNISVDATEKLLMYVLRGLNPLPLNGYIDSTDENSLDFGEIIADETQDTEKMVLDSLQVNYLLQKLKTICTEKEFEIFNCRYCFDMTYIQIAKKYNMTKQGVDYYCRRVLRKAKQILKEDYNALNVCNGVSI